jgi:secreted trypsin-like serine protease
MTTDDEECGSNDDFRRIAIAPQIGSWPWMGSIGHYDGQKKWVHKCGSTLIAASFVLTAAHCVPVKE